MASSEHVQGPLVFFFFFLFSLVPNILVGDDQHFSPVAYADAGVPCAMDWSTPSVSDMGLCIRTASARLFWEVFLCAFACARQWLY